MPTEYTPMSTVSRSLLSRSSTGSFLGMCPDFWKFHAVRFGPHVYLTTNPTDRHIHCRSLPGYFVKMDSRTMTFEDIASGEELMAVEASGSTLTVTLRLKRALCNGQLRPTPTPLLGPAPPPVRATVRPQTIPRELEPPPLLVNFSGVFPDSATWSVGSVPQKRLSLTQAAGKAIGKQNIFVHQAFARPEQYSGCSLPALLAAWRPCETRAKKRIIRGLHRLQGPRGPAPEDLLFDTKAYALAGDGLYGTKQPADDEPDLLKVGWISVYDTPQMLVPGMFDLVVALTLAVAMGFPGSRRGAPAAPGSQLKRALALFSGQISAPRP